MLAVTESGPESLGAVLGYWAVVWIRDIDICVIITRSPMRSNMP